MISTAHDDDRPVGTSVRSTAPAVPVADGIPRARRAPELGAEPVELPAARLDTAPPTAFRVAGHPAPHLERVVADLESSATTLMWALRLALLGAVGLVVLLLTAL